MIALGAVYLTLALGWDEPLSCGAASLRVLAEFAGFDVDAQRWAENLPDRPDGHSLDDLLAAAKRFDLSLVAEQIGTGVARLPDLAIVHLADERGNVSRGHFFAIRRIDPQWRQFQVLDSPHPLRVMSEAEIVAHPRFSGWVIRIESPWRRWAAAATCAAALGAALLAWRSKRGNRPTKARASAA